MMKVYDPEATRKALKDFMTLQGIKIAPWCRKAGLSNGTVRNFLDGRTRTMKQETLLRLASAAHVTIEEMLGETKNSPSELGEMYEQLSDENKALATRILRGLLADQSSQD